VHCAFNGAAVCRQQPLSAQWPTVTSSTTGRAVSRHDGWGHSHDGFGGGHGRFGEFPGDAGHRYRGFGQGFNDGPFGHFNDDGWGQRSNKGGLGQGSNDGGWGQGDQ
jgi:hypothetical protein